MPNFTERLPRPYECLPAADEPWLAPLKGLENAYAPDTIARTVTSFRFFQTWCALAGRTVLPADGPTLAAFVDAYSTLYAPRTMLSHLQAIQRVHLATGLASPADEEVVRMAVRRHRRSKPRRRRRLEVTAEVRDRLCEACSEGLAGLRDRAMINLAYDTFCYRGELTRLQVEDLWPLPDGTAELVVRRPRSNLQQAGTLVFLSPRGFKAVSAWIAAAGLTSGPILRAARAGRVGKRPLEPSSIGERFRVIAVRAGFSEDVVGRVTCQSFRVGAAQSLGASGRTLLQIMRAGRWRRPGAPAAYLREAEGEMLTGSDADIYPTVPGVELRRWQGRS